MPTECPDLRDPFQQNALLINLLQELKLKKGVSDWHPEHLHPLLIRGECVVSSPHDASWRHGNGCALQCGTSWRAMPTSVPHSRLPAWSHKCRLHTMYRSSRNAKSLSPPSNSLRLQLMQGVAPHRRAERGINGSPLLAAFPLSDYVDLSNVIIPQISRWLPKMATQQHTTTQQTIRKHTTQNNTTTHTNNNHPKWIGQNWIGPNWPNH